MGMEPNAPWLPADWPAPLCVWAGTTTRQSGCSRHPYASLNLAGHVGDAPADVRINRTRIEQALALPYRPRWLDQQHSARIIDPADEGCSLEADGACTSTPEIVCAVLTADCLPVLLCDREGRRVAALHCGWRGIAAGILSTGVTRMGCPPAEILAWLGPAIAPAAYEVGYEVHTAFLASAGELASAFRPVRPGRWSLDLYHAARTLLRASGVRAVYGGGRCTFDEEALFFSHRRDGITGRMATLIWRGVTEFSTGAGRPW